MKIDTEYQGRQLTIHTSKAADRALLERNEPLIVEMELYFSCLIRKQVRFPRQAQNCQPVNDSLMITFRPVMTSHCNVEPGDGPPPLTDFPIERAEAYVPHWLKLDYANDQWQGEFGYA